MAFVVLRYGELRRCSVYAAAGRYWRGRRFGVRLIERAKQYIQACLALREFSREVIQYAMPRHEEANQFRLSRRRRRYTAKAIHGDPIYTRTELAHVVNIMSWDSSYYTKELPPGESAASAMLVAAANGSSE